MDFNRCKEERDKVRGGKGKEETIPTNEDTIEIIPHWVSIGFFD